MAIVELDLDQNLATIHFSNANAPSEQLKLSESQVISEMSALT